jgi:hypothetical protein
MADEVLCACGHPIHKHMGNLPSAHCRQKGCPCGQSNPQRVMLETVPSDELAQLRVKAAQHDWLVAQFVSYAHAGPDGQIVGYRLRDESRFRCGARPDGAAPVLWRT